MGVIDIGSSSIRMAIAQITPKGEIRYLDNLHQAVPLGTDTFTIGGIRRETIEECVGVLSRFKRVLQEYGITESHSIHAIATSAVREAQNQDVFLDRVFIATGIEVEAIDEAEVNRLTFLVAQPLLAVTPALRKHPVLIVEVGAGSTELLVIEKDITTFSETYRLGALRMHEMLEAANAPSMRMRKLMQSSIQRTIEQMIHSVPVVGKVEMVVLGGDARFAVLQILGEKASGLLSSGEVMRLAVDKLAALADEITDLSTDELLQKYHMPVTDTEALGPALMTLAMMARAFGIATVHVSGITIRDGLLAEMASESIWTEKFEQQIIQSALDRGRKFGFDEPHGAHVADLSMQLFDQTTAIHGLGSKHRLLLRVAALLHEIGQQVSTRSHHKHSMYLIKHSELFGLSSREIGLIALVARYHRRAPPRPIHEGYATLDRESRIVVCKLAALLRTADALDRAHQQHIRRVESHVADRRLIITTPDAHDLTMERLAAKEKGSLFEQVYGLSVEFRSKATLDGDEQEP